MVEKAAYWFLLASSAVCFAKEMRPLSTDRPDKTESPYTVDAGHFQLEADLITFTQNRTGGITEESYSLFATNIKVGLTDHIDFQAIVYPYNVVRSTDRREGFGDTTLRLKVNLGGNDSGAFAWGVMSFVKLPTGGALSNQRVEGGILFPIALALPYEWNLGSMIQVNQNKNRSDNHFHSELIFTLAIGHNLLGNLDGYLELFSLSSNEPDSPWVATFDTGLTYRIGDNIQLDLGVNWGATEAAPDFNPFCGVSVKL